MADCHLGGWREPKLKELNNKSFCYVIDYCVKEKIDFVLIAGDLFNTALPDMESLQVCIKQLKKLKDNNIPVYFIAGSHDFSPSGKTMLSIIEDAGLGFNVAKGEVVENKLKLKFTIDEKTKVKITGIIGKRGGLDVQYYQELLREDLEKEEGYKIFMFHCALNEFKPKGFENIEGMNVSYFPKFFDYYAGGHVHVLQKNSLEAYPNIIYPGPVFPNSFSELEKLKHGSFAMVENNEVKHIPVKFHETLSYRIDCDNKSVEQVKQELKEITNTDLSDCIVTIKLKGTLSSGKPSDINFTEIMNNLLEKKAFVVLKNTSQLQSKDFEEIKIKSENVEDVESAVIKEHLDQQAFGQEFTQKIMQALSTEKQEGEKSADFEKRVIEDVEKMINN
ncbi:DNA repair exonuclease [archaeon]|nr:DNA repair exonuclease [archaeon]